MNPKGLSLMRKIIKNSPLSLYKDTKGDGDITLGFILTNTF